MATGDQNDTFSRIVSLFPGSWYADGPTPVRDSAIQGAAFNLSWVYTLYAYVLLQARIATATGVNLDKIANDFLGSSLPRLFMTDFRGVVTYETDTLYRARILKEILRQRNTRAGIVQAVADLTGLTPILVEPWNPNDTAAYGRNAYYGIIGTYGSLLLRNQIFVTAYRPSGQGIANIAGYGFGYYGAYTTAYINLAQMVGPITDMQIYARIKSIISAGITAWVRIQVPPLVLTTESGLLLESEAGAVLVPDTQRTPQPSTVTVVPAGSLNFLYTVSSGLSDGAWASWF